MPSYTIFLMNDHKQARQTQIHTHDLDNFQDSFSGCIFNFFSYLLIFINRAKKNLVHFLKLVLTKIRIFLSLMALLIFFNKRYKKVNVHSWSVVQFLLWFECAARNSNFELTLTGVIKTFRVQCKKCFTLRFKRQKYLNMPVRLACNVLKLFLELH